jgi:hypothetical protein
MFRVAVRAFPILCVLTLMTIGCAPEPIDVDVDQGMTTSELLKQDLQMIVDNGQMGSEMGSIENNLFKLKETNASLADELSADLQELQSLSGAEVVNKAKAMINKL